MSATTFQSLYMALSLDIMNGHGSNKARCECLLIVDKGNIVLAIHFSRGAIPKLLNHHQDRELWL